MNKELIKKYKTEFEHWLNGGKVLFKNTISADTWNCEDADVYKILCVIDDEYVEYRKKIAEGKTIQVLKTTWTDCESFTSSSTFSSPVSNYRIKPEEPKFKVGDYVRYHKNTTSIFKLEPYHLLNLPLYNYLTPWTPQKGEICYFWDNNGGRIIIEKFSKTDGKYFKDVNNVNWDNCIPALNLPHEIKELLK